MPIPYSDFESVEIRAGTIIDAEPLEGARKPAYKLTIDFGPEIGTKRSSAQITAHYPVDMLLGLQVLAVVNFEPKRIAGFSSEVLTLGVPDKDGEVVLVMPSHPVPDGARLF